MSWFRSAIADLYDAVSAPVAAAHNVLSKRLGTPDVDRGMVGASVEADRAMGKAAWSGHIESVELHKAWGAADFDGAVVRAAESGHV